MTDPTTYTATSPDGVQRSGPTPLHAAARLAWAVWEYESARHKGLSGLVISAHIAPGDYCGRQYVLAYVEVDRRGPQVARVSHPVAGLNGRPTHAVETAEIRPEHWRTP